MSITITKLNIQIFKKRKSTLSKTVFFLAYKEFLLINLYVLSFPLARKRREEMKAMNAWLYSCQILCVLVSKPVTTSNVLNFDIYFWPPPFFLSQECWYEKKVCAIYRLFFSEINEIFQIYNRRAHFKNSNTAQRNQNLSFQNLMAIQKTLTSGLSQ